MKLGSIIAPSLPNWCPKILFVSTSMVKFDSDSDSFSKGTWSKAVASVSNSMNIFPVQLTHSILAWYSMLVIWGKKFSRERSGQSVSLLNHLKQVLLPWNS